MFVTLYRLKESIPYLILQICNNMKKKLKKMSKNRRELGMI